MLPRMAFIDALLTMALPRLDFMWERAARQQ